MGDEWDILGSSWEYLLRFHGRFFVGKKRSIAHGAPNCQFTWFAAPITQVYSGYIYS